MVTGAVVPSDEHPLRLDVTAESDNDRTAWAGSDKGGRGFSRVMASLVPCSYRKLLPLRARHGTVAATSAGVFRAHCVFSAALKCPGRMVTPHRRINSTAWDRPPEGTDDGVWSLPGVGAGACSQPWTAVVPSGESPRLALGGRNSSRARRDAARLGPSQARTVDHRRSAILNVTVRFMLLPDQLNASRR